MKHGRLWRNHEPTVFGLLLPGIAVLGLLLPGTQRELAAQVESTPPGENAETEDLRLRLKEMEAELKALRERQEEQDLQFLRIEAGSEGATREDVPEERTYITAARSLQMLNPEISVCGDAILQVIANDRNMYEDEHDRTGIRVRALGLHIQSSLDPFSLVKAAIEFLPGEGVALEEAYITWNGIVPSLSITVGRFRQLFGVVNRWHEHDLDQIDYPLAIETLFGEGGLAQTGLSLRWLMPALWAHANELTLEVTDGFNGTLFSGEHFHVPSFLGHIKSYYDLNENTYLEFGLSGMFGLNNRRGYRLASDPASAPLREEPWMKTYVAGGDLTLYWQPLRKAKYQSLTWRSEGYWVLREGGSFQERDLVGPAEGRYQMGWGVYSYLQYQFNESWFVGVRGDVVSPAAYNDGRETWWQVSPYVTFWQSEFVYLRLEARHGRLGHGRDTRFLLQLNFAAGPHKHEKY